MKKLQLPKKWKGNESTEEEILSMVNEGQEQGVILDSEAKMISRIMEFGDKEAQDVMTNRNNIHAFDANITLKEAVEMIMNDHFSRFPVYEETIDHVIGFIYLKDAMRMQMHEKMNQMSIGSIRRLLRKPVFVPETKSIDSVFRMMQTSKTQMVVVIDEYGQTSGILTLEDILEEIVGNIQDEFDVDDKFVISAKQDGYIFSGTTPLEYIEELLQIDLEQEEYETLNGFVIGKLEHIPEEGDVGFAFEASGYDFSVLEVKNRMIQEVGIKRKKMETTVDETVS
ncbi:MAG: hemolysin family protein [Lachnospiraceae bacterium]|nr:hemolysin family protein [Clostridiales bacterium]MDY3108884.1 hemolysin family protein [Lachnospiraceae bacterium]